MKNNDIIYQQWLEYIFNHPTTKSKWFFDIHQKRFEVTNDEIIHFVKKMCANSGVELLKYSDSQADEGVQYIFGNFGSIASAIVTKGVAEGLRVDAVASMKILYKDCFAKRCSPSLSHLDEKADIALNHVCYMLWDISPLTSWKDVVLDVMEYALYIPHIACIESGLHGLGHRHSQDRGKVESIIDRFLVKTKSLRPELRACLESRRRALKF